VEVAVVTFLFTSANGLQQSSSTKSSSSSSSTSSSTSFYLEQVDGGYLFLTDDVRDGTNRDGDHLLLVVGDASEELGKREEGKT